MSLPGYPSSSSVYCSPAAKHLPRRQDFVFPSSAGDFAGKSFRVVGGTDAHVSLDVDGHGIIRVSPDETFGLERDGEFIDPDKKSLYPDTYFTFSDEPDVIQTVLMQGILLPIWDDLSVIIPTYYNFPFPTDHALSVDGFAERFEGLSFSQLTACYDFKILIEQILKRSGVDLKDVDACTDLLNRSPLLRTLQTCVDSWRQFRDVRRLVAKCYGVDL